MPGRGPSSPPRPPSRRVALFTIPPSSFSPLLVYTPGVRREGGRVGGKRTGGAEGLRGGERQSLGILFLRENLIRPAVGPAYTRFEITFTRVCRVPPPSPGPPPPAGLSPFFPPRAATAP